MNYLDIHDVSKLIDDYGNLAARIERIISIVMHDTAENPEISIDGENINVYYLYHSHGYQYDDGLTFPFKLLTASDEELYAFRDEKNRIEAEMHKKNEEMRKAQEELDKIKREKAELKRLKDKYEK